MTKVKICGITNLEDALEAVRLGADALGFVFAPSPRRISPKDARGIVAGLPPFVTRVGVFVDSSKDEIRGIVNECRLDAVQLHGGGTDDPELPAGVRTIKVVRVGDQRDVGLAETIEADAVLLDSKVEGLVGGTGASFDWELLATADFRSPLILSGGLDPGNVENAILKVRPYAVDASSKIEERPGKKDHGKLEAFIEAVREADKRMRIGGLAKRQPAISISKSAKDVRTSTRTDRGMK